MPVTALVIPADGDPYDMTFPKGSGNLRKLQELVGGDIEGAPIIEPAAGYINGEGKFDPDCGVNFVATGLCSLFLGDYIAGTMVVFGPTDRHGNDTSVLKETRERAHELNKRRARFLEILTEAVMHGEERLSPEPQEPTDP